MVAVGRNPQRIQYAYLNVHVVNTTTIKSLIHRQSGAQFFSLGRLTADHLAALSAHKFCAHLQVLRYNARSNGRYVS